MTQPIVPLTRFLAPLDGRPACWRALKFADCMAAALGDRIESITLLHVLAGGYLSSHMSNIDARIDDVLESALFQRLRETYVEHEVQPMLAEAEAEAIRRGVTAPLDLAVADGEPAEQIALYAQEGGYSTVVMGRRSLTSIRKILFGSVATTLLRRELDAAVYVVGRDVETDKPCRQPRIIVGVDGSEHSLAATREAAVLAGAFGDDVEEVVLLRVIDVARYAERIADGQSPEADAERMLVEARRTMVAGGVAEERIVSLARYGRPVSEILTVADERRSTLIMVGRRGRTGLRQLFMGSVSSGILQAAVGPTVAVVGASPDED